jgi:hypothetical protein
LATLVGDPLLMRHFPEKNMRTITATLSLLTLVVLAAPGLAQDAAVWRAYDLGRNRMPYLPKDWRTPAFGILGTAPPSKTQAPEAAYLGEPGKAPQFDKLARILFSELVPKALVENSGHRLVVRGTPEEHRIVTRTLQLLRDPRSHEIELRRLVLPRRLEAEGERLVAAALAGRLDADGWARLRKLDVDGGHEGGSVHAIAGAWTLYESTRRIEYVSDYDVEIAQAAAIADPIVQQATEGLRAAVRGFPLSDGRLLVRLVASAGRLDPTLRRFEMKATDLPDSLRIRDTDYGEMEQADYRGGVIATELILKRGVPSAVMLASPDHRTARRSLLYLTLKSSPREAEETTLALIPTGALTSARQDRRVWVAFGGQPSWRDEEMADEAHFEGAMGPIEDLVEGLDDAITRQTEIHGGALLVRAPKPRIAAMRTMLGKLERTVLHPVRFEIQLVSIRDNKRSAIGRVSHPMLCGTGAAFGAYRCLDYVSDYDVEVAQESRISDPVHRVATAGILGNADLARAGNNRYRLRLELEVSAIEEPVATRLNTGSVGPLQRVPRKVRRSTFILDLEAGRAREIDLGADPFGDERGARLVAMVTCTPKK